MPSIETTDRHDKVLCWLRSTTAHGFDEYGNEAVNTEEYTELLVRWEEERNEVRDSHTGHLVDYDVRCVVDREVEKGSVLWKGSEEDYLGQLGTDGTADDEVMDLLVVVERGHIPDIKGRNTRRVVYLRRKNDTDPGAN